jgi:DNA-3-methyladenine glycosylase I
VSGPGEAPAGRGPQPGPDGLPRCPWALSAPEYVAYHDQEWGRPVREDDAMFERLSLEAFQSGLSWLTILRKRPAFRAAFAGFSVQAVAGFDTADQARLLADAGIVRNRSKIAATIANARSAAALPGGLCALLWSFAPAAPDRAPRTLDDVRAVSPESTAMARELKRRGFTFVGPTTAYALMQATGMVDDHLLGCYARAGGRARRSRPPDTGRPRRSGTG